MVFLKGYERRGIPTGLLPNLRFTKGVPLCSFLMDLSAGIVGLSVPLMAVSLGVSPLILGSLVAIQRMTYIVFVIIAGRLSDRFTPKRLVETAAILLTLIFLSMSMVKKVSYLFILVPFVGIGTGMFWAPMQAWMGGFQSGFSLAQTVANFNMAWSIGALIGNLIAGGLFSIRRSLPFLFASLGTVTIFGIARGLPTLRVGDRVLVHNNRISGSGTYETTERMDTNIKDESGSSPRMSLQQSLRILGWVSTFTGFFVAGITITLFPKIAAEEGINPFMVGTLLAAISVSRTITFYSMGRKKGWQYREIPLIMALLAGALGTGVVAFLSGVAIYMVGFLLMGIAQGTGYMASLFYSLDGGEQTGRKAGIHEALVNSGAMAGAFIGGALAEAFTLKAPYVFSMFLTAFVGVYYLGCRSWIKTISLVFWRGRQ